LEQTDKFLLFLDNHLASPLHHLWRDVIEFEILESANLVTSILPESVRSFFAREQAIGSLNEKTKQFDSFGALKESLTQHKKALEDKQNES